MRIFAGGSCFLLSAFLFADLEEQEEVLIDHVEIAEPQGFLDCALELGIYKWQAWVDYKNLASLKLIGWANELTTIIKDALKTDRCVTITITEIRLIQLQ